MKKKFKAASILLALALCFSNILTVHAVTVAPTEHSEEAISRAAIPIESNSYINWPEGPVVYSSSAIVMEMSTGAILYEKNVHEKLYPASITKIMTVMLALENCSLNETVTFSHNSVFDIEPGSSIIGGVDEGDQLTLEQCLYGIMVSSGNEAAYAVAEHVAGDLTSFANMMNEKAKSLGCLNTNFINANGLHNENHYTSAYDMALIAKAAYQIPAFQTLCNTPRYVLPPDQFQPETRTLNNKHKLMAGKEYEYEWCKGGKTGYTSDAQSTLVTYAERDGMNLVCVIMRDDSPTQFFDTVNLLNYCLDNFQKLNISENETHFSISNANFFKTNNNIFGNTNALVEMNQSGSVVIPKFASFADVSPALSFENQTETSVAALSYTYGGHYVGATTIDLANTAANKFEFGAAPVTPDDDEIIVIEQPRKDTSKKSSLHDTSFITINLKIILTFLVFLIFIVVTILLLHILLKNFCFTFSKKERIKRRQRRGTRRRKKHTHYNFDDFDFREMK